MKRFVVPRSILRLCGVDEAGRGPLAGPVVAAAVILDPKRPIRGLADVKLLTAERREVLATRIRDRAIAWSVALATVEEIDRINILHASMLAMKRAIDALATTPELVIVDGNRLPHTCLPARAIVDGDALEASISAASILAKVARDSMLDRLHDEHPHYGFCRHRGYGTPEHLAALERHGAIVHHRRSFAPVRFVLDRATDSHAPDSFA
ncbi:ribonuclease HII [soil metagenome]